VSTIEDQHTAPPVMDIEPAADEPRRRRRGLVWLTLAAVLVAAAGFGTWRWTSDASTETSRDATGPVATATVERGTLSATDTWEGTLDHGAPFTVKASGNGTLTRLVAQGQTVERGSELYRLNEQPVILLSGVVPMYRDLRPGDSGIDVEQLERNLAELGYDGFTVDVDYTSSTAEAVRAWQADIGADQTGTVARGDVVFVPTSGQVDALHADVGEVVTAGTPILDITGTEQVVSLEVGIDDRDRLDVGTPVTVVLPDGNEITGTVSTTNVVEVTPGARGEDAGGAQAQAESIAQVEIAVNEAAPDEAVGAPVDVVVAIDQRTDVLIVPVNAILARAEGGYGLEIVHDDGTTSIIKVDTGLSPKAKSKSTRPNSPRARSSGWQDADGRHAHRRIAAGRQRRRRSGRADWRQPHVPRSSTGPGPPHGRPPHRPG
jgi:peptidoglycan hydrolase-like protein with peptidoglycan-binding domain